MKSWHLGGLTVLLLAAGVGAAAAAGNPLIGTWKLTGPGYIDRDGNNYCEAIPQMVFTPSKQIMFAAATKFKPAAQGVTNVFYLVAGNKMPDMKVYVSSDQSFFNAPDYLVLAPNRIESDTAGHCIYQKQ